MPVRTGKCILARNIKLDRDYKNILNYTETQMVNLVTTNAVATRSNCSFTRPDSNEIILDVPYGTALQANYLAFQNPDYSNKWFFAFIEDISYQSNGTTKVVFSIDECATWFDYWHVEPCFVVREHANTDVAGDNTYPENVETGDFIVQPPDKPDSSSSPAPSYNINFLVSDNLYPVIGVSDTGLDASAPAPEYNGVFSGIYYIAFPNFANARAYINKLNVSFSESPIVTMFMCPSKLFMYEGFTWHNYPASGTLEFQYGFVPSKSTVTEITHAEITKPTTIDGYTPRNKKLLTHQFNYLEIYNNAGSANIYAYELFKGAGSSSSTTCNFSVIGAICTGCSIQLIPINYNKTSSSDWSSTFDNYEEALDAPKLPTCGWNNDSFTNWLTQNAVNIGIGFVSNTLQIAGAAGLIAGGDFKTSRELLGAGIGGIGNSVMSIYEHSRVPNSARGSQNQGDLTYSSKRSFSIYKKCIKAEFARIIDDYFDRKGYATNRIKVPNQTGRTYWNYVQIAAEDDIGYSSNANISVPAKSMEVINNVYRKGVTIWHNHANIGDYSLNNTIVS